MSLVFLPTTHRSTARLNATRPRFRLNDEVRVGGDPRVARVEGFRSPKPHTPEVLIGYADGCTCWVAERNLRAARAKLELVTGGGA